MTPEQSQAAMDAYHVAYSAFVNEAFPPLSVLFVALLGWAFGRLPASVS